VSPLLTQLPAAFAAALSAAGVVQTLAALFYVRRFADQAPAPADALPPITVLKPLCDDEPMLATALETFFRQDYPALQLVFGVQRADDPAIPVVQALCRRYAHVDAVLVVDPARHGTNPKIANLINMFPSARHDVLVVSDSDMHVAPDYLRCIAAAFRVPGTGLVTSLYVGKPAGGGITTQLGAAYINQIFAAGAVMARVLGRQDCLGATMALTRGTLRRIGGFAALSPYVADDGVLGRMVLATGRSIGLAASVPATTVSDDGFAALFRHELRWSRTIRAMAMMKTLFLQPPSFDGFDGGAGSRYQAKREIRSFWYPTWLAQPAALVPGSKLIDAPPAASAWIRCRGARDTSCA
jgi:ceramide glucosyltransferase